MKNFFLILIGFLVFTLTTQAQNYEMAYAPDTIWYNPAASYIDCTSHLKNISGTTDSIFAERRSNLLTPGHKTNFCWGGTCFPDETPSSAIFNAYVALQDNQVDSTFKLTLFPNNNTGTTIVVMRFYKTSDLNKYLDQSYVFVADPAASISSEDLDRGFMLDNPYPNPATDVAWIAYQLPQHVNQASLRMVDMNGRMIQEQAISRFEQRAQLQTEGLATGAYFIQLMAEGRVVGTAKLYVK